MKTTTTHHIGRGNYGEIFTAATPWARDVALAPATYHHARAILAAAIASKTIEAPYVDVDKKHRGSALNYDLYDFAPGAALVQKRETRCTKYGNSPKKSYLVLRRREGKITVTSADAHKAKIAKLAKSELPWGGVLAAIEGRKPAKIRVATLPPVTGYKVLRRAPQGYASVWDDSAWELGRERCERLSDDAGCPYADHPTSGLYYYATAEEAIVAAQNNDVFGTARSHSDLVVVEVRVRGRRAPIIESEYGVKRAATYLLPLREVATLPAAS